MNIFQVVLTQPLANGLILFYKLLGENMGVAIIAFSLFLRVVLYPLTKPYMESMKKMKSYQKELDRLKKKHKGDRQKLMSAQSDFYKEKGINPSAGCLPYLLQIVVLIAFFNVFSRTLAPNADTVAKFNELLYPALKFAEGTMIHTKFLFLDVTKPDVITGIAPFPLPGIFLILSAVAQLVTAKISAPYIETEKKIAEKTKTESDDMQVAMQQSMVFTFPLITLLVGLNFSSGLVLYWLVFSLSQAYQQYRSSGWGGLTPWLKRLNLIQ